MRPREGGKISFVGMVFFSAFLSIGFLIAHSNIWHSVQDIFDTFFTSFTRYQEGVDLNISNTSPNVLWNVMKNFTCFLFK